jgi:CRP/FNR family transcriptional regulator, cyclic AMP receptor protein
MQDESTARRLGILKQVSLFSGLTEKALAEMASDLRVREYERDDVIFRQGEDSREVYIVLSGKVRVFKISPGGSETSIDIFSTYDIIREMAAIDFQPRSATVQAITPATLLVMAQERFLHHLRTNALLSFNLARQISLRLRWTASFAESVAQFDAAGRLLHIILLYTERYGKPIEAGRSYILELGLSQSDLASMVGARREWVNRILAEWRKRGLLEFDRGVITLLDLPRVVEERDSRTEANVNSSAW